MDNQIKLVTGTEIDSPLFNEFVEKATEILKLKITQSIMADNVKGKGKVLPKFDPKHGDKIVPHFVPQLVPTFGVVESDLLQVGKMVANRLGKKTSEEKMVLMTNINRNLKTDIKLKERLFSPVKRQVDLAEEFSFLSTEKAFTKMMREMHASGIIRDYGLGGLLSIMSPATPTGLKAVSGSNLDVRLTWTGNSEADLAGYEIAYLESGTTAWHISSIGKERTDITIGGLAEGSNSFKIRAKDTSGNYSAYSAEVNATVGKPVDRTSPATPIGLKVVSGSNLDVRLTWTGNSEADLAGYEIAYLKSGTTAWDISTIGKNTTDTIIGELAEGSNSFKIRAKDTSGNYSAYSAEVSATVPRVNKALKLRLHGVYCLDETDPEWIGSDEIALGGVTINDKQQRAQITEFLVREGFEKDVSKLYNPPKTLAQFDLDSSYPKSFTALISIAEKDDEGFSQFIRDLYETLKPYVAEIVAAVLAAIGIGAAIGAKAGSATGGWIGAAIGAIIGALIGWLIVALKDDIFEPQMAIAGMNTGNATFDSGKLESSIMSLYYEDHGGKYKVDCSWEVIR